MRFTIFIAGVLLAISLVAHGAGGASIECADCSTNAPVTNSFNTTLMGPIDSLAIHCEGVWTGDVSVATGYETILSLTDTTATNLFRPGVPRCDSTGSAYGVSTNDHDELVYLCDDTVTVTATTKSGLARTNDVTVYIRMKR